MRYECLRVYFVSLGEFFLMHQDIPHGFNVSLAIISAVLCDVSTRRRVIWMSSCSKPYSGIARQAVIFIVGDYTNSGSTMTTATQIEPFFITV